MYNVYQAKLGHNSYNSVCVDLIIFSRNQGFSAPANAGVLLDCHRTQCHSCAIKQHQEERQKLLALLISAVLPMRERWEALMYQSNVSDRRGNR